MNARTRYRRFRLAGFTLVEVVLAIMVMGISLGALMTAMVRSLEVLTHAKRYQTAQWALGTALSEHPLIVTNRIEDVEVDPVESGHGFYFSREIDATVEKRKDDLHVIVSRVAMGRDGEGAYMQTVYDFVFFEEDD